MEGSLAYLVTRSINSLAVLSMLTFPRLFLYPTEARLSEGLTPMSSPTWYLIDSVSALVKTLDEEMSVHQALGTVEA